MESPFFRIEIFKICSMIHTFMSQRKYIQNVSTGLMRGLYRSDMPILPKDKISPEALKLFNRPDGPTFALYGKKDAAIACYLWEVKEETQEMLANRIRQSMEIYRQRYKSDYPLNKTEEAVLKAPMQGASIEWLDHPKRKNDVNHIEQVVQTLEGVIGFAFSLRKLCLQNGLHMRAQIAQDEQKGMTLSYLHLPYLYAVK